MAPDGERIRVLQASNISPQANREQLYQLFSFLGRIEEIKVCRFSSNPLSFSFLQTYPSETNPMYSTMNQKLAYIRYDDEKAVEVGQHLTNTVFIDRALVCIPYISSELFQVNRTHCELPKLTNKFQTEYRTKILH